jgi:hypothetical protein
MAPCCDVRRIISGAQSGADTGALQAARQLGLETGGFAPKGFRTEGGLRPELREWGLVELDSRSYAVRTRANVVAADAVLILSVIANSPGTRLTVATAVAQGKPWLQLDPYDPGVEERIRAFLGEHRPPVLMVAGNRETVAPGIAGQVARVLVQAIHDNGFETVFDCQHLINSGKLCD